MRNIRLIVEYEGTEYAGWQWQKDLPTVQGKLMEAVKALTGGDAEVSGASRTDAGVHAYAQVAAFRTDSTLEPFTILRGLNHYLPPDIVVKDAQDASPEFDPRRDSKGKVYVYRIMNRPVPTAIMRRHTWFVPKPLDLKLMREAAGHFMGEKDFSSFRAADSDAAHSVREVTSVELVERGDGLVEVEVRGTAFLRHMIRIMAGTLVDVGKGKLAPGEVKAIIEARDRARASMTAPPQGLMLMKVEY